MSNTSKLSYI